MSKKSSELYLCGTRLTLYAEELLLFIGHSTELQAALFILTVTALTLNISGNLILCTDVAKKLLYTQQNSAKDVLVPTHKKKKVTETQMA